MGAEGENIDRRGFVRFARRCGGALRNSYVLCSLEHLHRIASSAEDTECHNISRLHFCVRAVQRLPYCTVERRHAMDDDLDELTVDDPEYDTAPAPGNSLIHPNSRYCNQCECPRT